MEKQILERNKTEERFPILAQKIDHSSIRQKNNNRILRLGDYSKAAK